MTTWITEKNKKVRPGIKSYKTWYKNSLRKQLVVFDTSLLNGVKNKELNKRLSNCIAYAFLGATAQQIQIYVQPTLQKCILDTVLIRAGCHSIYNKENSFENKLHKSAKFMGSRMSWYPHWFIGENLTWIPK